MTSQKYAYQSPISLHSSTCIPINQEIKICGINHWSEYNYGTKNFEVKDEIFLTVQSEKYKLVEYHFHNKGEHTINHKCYDGEVHFVFIECSNVPKYNKNVNLCKCHSADSFPGTVFRVNSANCEEDKTVPVTDIVVIGRMIKHTDIKQELENIHIKIPSNYFEYDGTLTTGTYSPVRWIIGKHSIRLNMEDVAKQSKSARPIQDNDGRIVLYSDR
jgi:carbonic anhydrase